MRPRRSEVAMAGLIALVFGAGPMVGDVGSCGRTASDLDPVAFAQARKLEDCQRCSLCGLATASCRSDCDPDAGTTVGWPPTCRPLQHDGEACLRALASASCREYASFVNDVAPSLPTECDFCHVVADGAFGDP